MHEGTMVGALAPVLGRQPLFTCIANEQSEKLLAQTAIESSPPPMEPADLSRASAPPEMEPVMDC